MFKPEMYEEHLDDVYDGCIERIKEIISKEILENEDMEELKELMEYIEADYSRRYFDGSEENDTLYKLYEQYQDIFNKLLFDEENNEKLIEELAKIAIAIEEKAEKHLISLINKAALKSGNNFMKEFSVKPHITLAAFNTKNEQEVLEILVSKTVCSM